MTDAELQELLEQVRAQTEALERLTDVMRSSTQTKSSTSAFTDKSARAIIEKSSNDLNRQISSIVNKNLGNITGIAKSATMAKKEARTTARSQGKSAAEISAAGAKAAVPHMQKLAKVSAVLGAGFGGLAMGTKQFSSALAAGTLNAGGVASSFGSVVSSVTSVTKSFGPLGFALSTAVDAIVSFGIAAAKQGSAQADVFNKLAESGANTSGGLTGINIMLDKFNLKIGDAAKVTALISANAPGLALFKGNVADGVKAMADISKEIGDKGLRREFKLLGHDTDAQRVAQMRYMSVMSKSGLAQTMTVKQLTDGAVNYLREQDRLTRLTGASAAEQEAAREQALAEEQFQIRQFRLRQGTAEDIAKAEREQLTYQKISAISGKKAATAYGASLDGLTTAANVGAQALTGGAITNIATSNMSPDEQAMAVHEVYSKGINQAMTAFQAGKGREMFNVDAETVQFIPVRETPGPLTNLLRKKISWWLCRRWYSKRTWQRSFTIVARYRSSDTLSWRCYSSKHFWRIC
jgi:hypothetical protein